jgi:uncharacterized protein YjbI with pentapeptide repeats
VLTGANLRDADLREAQLDLATLEGVLISPEQLGKARLGYDSL